MEQNDMITIEEFRKRISNIKLEEMTSEDIDGYLAYGTEEELNNPEFQRILVQRNYITDLMDSVDIITDREVIKAILSSNVFKEDGYKIIEAEILSIRRKVFIKSTNGNVYCSSVRLRNKHNSKIYELKHQVFMKTGALEEYKAKLKPYYNDVAVIVRKSDTSKEYLIICYLKKYEDIDYNSNGDYDIS